MTETETTWAARVAEWRASGKTVEEFTDGEPYAPSTLRWWSSRLRRRVKSPRVPSVAMVKVVRASERVHEPEPVVIAVGAARIEVRSGFDASLLRDVVAALGAAR